MAIIDLRHLVEPEYDIVKFIGSEDKQEYSIPVKKTVGMSLMLNQYFSDFNKSCDPDMPDAVKNIEFNYFMITTWVRGFYPDLTVEWVKSNIPEVLFIELVRLLEPIFFPKLKEPGMPKKNRKKGKS
jgi:hypothetical protein